MDQKETAKMPQIKPSKMDEMFTLVKDKDGVKIAIGNYQVSKKVFRNWADADQYIAKKPYEILVNVTCLFSQMHLKNESTKTTAEKTKKTAKNA